MRQVAGWEQWEGSVFPWLLPSASVFQQWMVEKQWGIPLLQNTTHQWERTNNWYMEQLGWISTELHSVKKKLIQEVTYCMIPLLKHSWKENRLILSGFKLKCLIAHLCLSLCDPMDCSPPRLFSLWDSSGKDTGVRCHFLFQGTNFKTRTLHHLRRPQAPSRIAKGASP